MPHAARIDSPNDLVRLIKERGGEISYLLPDHHNLLKALRVSISQQNRAFSMLDELRRKGIVRRNTEKVFPAETYGTGKGEVFVRKVVFTLVVE